MTSKATYGKSKPSTDGKPVLAEKDVDCFVYIVPHRIQKKRLSDIKAAVKKKGFPLDEDLSARVTHIVTEYETLEQVSKALKGQLEEFATQNVVKMSWLSASLKAGTIIPVEDSHRLMKQMPDEEREDEQAKTETAPHLAEWACMRITPLKHHNEQFTRALETLQEHAELRDSDQDYSRALAFRRASCVLKSLPCRVTSLAQLTHCKDIGGHSRRVIKEILEDGVCDEVENILHDPWFQKMKLFSSVFGVGPSTAKKWTDRGWNSIEDAQRCDNVSNDWRVIWGLAFHKDLMCPVLLQEARAFLQLVKREAERILPGVVVELTGGFRRGKESGHDVDILLTSPAEGAEEGLLPRLLEALERQGLVLSGVSEKNSFTSDVLSQDFKLSARGQLDHFEKWLGICKFPPSFRARSSPTHSTSKVASPDAETPDSPHKAAENPGNTDNTDSPPVGSRGAGVLKKGNASPSEERRQSPPHGSWDDTPPPPSKLKRMTAEGMPPQELAKSPREWLARRVDLIVAPYSQYFYALVGWTGNKHFNRDLRLYATRVLGKKLTSHGLYDQGTGRSLPAGSEREVFKNLKIDYKEPWERNC